MFYAEAVLVVLSLVAALWAVVQTVLVSDSDEQHTYLASMAFWAAGAVVFLDLAAMLHLFF
jgi:hypothetical protein